MPGIESSAIVRWPSYVAKLSIVGSLRDREVACSASDLQGLNFKSCVWRPVSSHSSHHPQEVILPQISRYVHKSGLKPDSFFFSFILPMFSEPRDMQMLKTEYFLLWNVSWSESHHPQEVLLAHFSLYVHKVGLKPDSFHILVWKLKHWTLLGI